MGPAALVLVGADAVSSRGPVNQTGTAPVALAASRFRVPRYALCGSEKFLPPDYEPLQNLRELPGFDSTPLRCLAGIVTEDGVTSPSPAP